MMFKISPINLNKISSSILNLKYNKKIADNTTKTVQMENLPYVTVPLIVYIQSKTSQNNLDSNLVKETAKDSTNHPITYRTETNIKALKKAGLNESEAKKHINSNGYIDDDGKNICKNKNITSFKGAPQENVDLDNDPALMMDSELKADLKDLNSIGTEMSPELEKIYESPVLDSPEEILTSIYGEIPEGFDIDWDFWSILKSIYDEILDFGDWV